MGTYLVQVGDECTMTVQTWRLLGEIHQFVNLTAERTGMTVPTLELADMIPVDWFRNNNNDTMAHSPLNNDFNDFNDDKMNDLMNSMESMNDGYEEKWIGHNIAWGILGIVLCVGMVLIAGGRYIYIKRKKIHYFLADAKKPDKPKRSNLLSMSV